MTRQEVLKLVEQLPEQKLPVLAEFIQLLVSQRVTENGSDEEFDEGQKELLDLLNYCVDTGITDLARNHDHYLYGTEPSAEMESDLEDQQELDEEQKRLLNLLNYTISSERGDFAENHDFYLYDRKGRIT